MTTTRVAFLLALVWCAGCSRKPPAYVPVQPQDTAQVRPEEKPVVPDKDPT